MGKKASLSKKSGKKVPIEIKAVVNQEKIKSNQFENENYGNNLA